MADLKIANEKLVAVEKTRNTNNDVSTRSLIEVDVAHSKMDKALQELVELQKVANGLVYQQVFERGFSRAGDYYLGQVAKLLPGIF